MSARLLDTNEEIFHVFDKRYAACRTAQLLRLDGPLNESVLREGMQRLVVMHERLGQVISEHDGRVEWQARAYAPTLRVLAPEAGKDPASLLSSSLDGEATVPVWWLEWVPGESAQLLNLVLHHSVADGVSAARLAGDLVTILNDVVAGRPLGKTVTSAPPLDSAMAPISLPNDIAYRIGRLRWRFFGKPGALPRFEQRAGPKERTTRVLFDAIEASVISGLRQRASEEGATVGGAVTAAVLRAIATVDDLHAKVDVATQVSLRARCKPPIPSEAIGCFGARALTQHEGGRPFWRLAKECSLAVRKSLDSGESEIPLVRTRGKVHYVSAALERLVDNPENLGRTCTLAISNLGVLDETRGGPLRLTGFYPAIANHPAGSLYQLSCGTLGGVLQCTWMYVAPLVSDERAKTIWQVARDEMTRAAS